MNQKKIVNPQYFTSIEELTKSYHTYFTYNYKKSSSMTKKIYNDDIILIQWHLRILFSDINENKITNEFQTIVNSILATINLTKKNIKSIPPITIRLVYNCIIADDNIKSYYFFRGHGNTYFFRNTLDDCLWTINENLSLENFKKIVNESIHLPHLNRVVTWYANTFPNSQCYIHNITHLMYVFESFI